MEWLGIWEDEDWSVGRGQIVKSWSLEALEEVGREHLVKNFMLVEWHVQGTVVALWVMSFSGRSHWEWGIWWESKTAWEAFYKYIVTFDS